VEIPTFCGKFHDFHGIFHFSWNFPWKAMEKFFWGGREKVLVVKFGGLVDNL
jgi:hypothetical protein